MLLQSTIRSLSQRAAGPLEVYLMGVVDFESALFLQERLVYDISGRSDTLGGLLLCEHPPMVTIGREGSRADLPPEPAELLARQMPVRWLNRGGGCLVHAPGQLAVYPIIPLDRLGIGLSDYRRRLHDAVIDVAGEVRVSAWRRPEETGLWCRTGQFAHLGVAVKSWVTYHGMFINVCPDLDVMRLVRSNADGERVTSLATQRFRPTSMHQVRESLVRNLAARLGYRRHHLYTGHPLLRRRSKKKAYVHI